MNLDNSAIAGIGIFGIQRFLQNLHNFQYRLMIGNVFFFWKKRYMNLTINHKSI